MTAVSLGRVRRKVTAEPDASIGREYYLRARYMNPASGRFTQQDSFAGFDSDPPSLHKYLYTPSNPVNYTDPSGNSYLGAVSFAANLTLTAISVVNTTIVAHDFLTGERELSAKEVGIAIVWAYVGSKGGPLFGRLERALQKSGCLGNSFTPDTLIETEDGLRRIDEVKVGDLVLSRNMETGANELQPVTAVMTSTKLVEIVSVRLDSGVTIEATPEHLMFINSGWAQAQEIRAGSELSDVDNRAVQVRSVSRSSREVAVYDLTVAQNRNFYVSQSRVLVHNISPCEKAAQALAKAVPRACTERFMCKDFARKFEELLVKKEMKGKRLCVNSRTGRIWSNTFRLISDNGIHVAVQIGELVFDNNFPDGKPYGEWADDIGLGEFEDLDVKEEGIGAPGCLDD